MEAGYLGGMLDRDVAWRPPAGADWRCVLGDNELSLSVPGACARLYAWDTLALVVRGYARPSGDTGPLNPDALAEELRCQYLDSGELAVHNLDGSFTVALLDAQASRVI